MSEDRARRILKMAADKAAEDGFSDLQGWLTEDPDGMWGKIARECIQETRALADRLMLTEDEVDEHISNRLLYHAVSVALQVAKAEAGKVQGEA